MPDRAASRFRFSGIWAGATGRDRTGGGAPAAAVTRFPRARMAEGAGAMHWIERLIFGGAIIALAATAVIHTRQIERMAAMLPVASMR